ncbi:MAG: ATP-dependent Clp protease adaptor ClpS [Desulfobacterales bacterium]|nr:MAG: ATP-dependent Clp protease adaptor ClpS [Desulfobacterales bacterium]
MSTRVPDLQEGIISATREKITEPPLYKVLLHNDDFTTKLFVVDILMAVFQKSMEEATQIMWHVHKNGIGVCGVYTYEVAETKVKLTTAAARENGFPLQTTLEPE